MSTHPTMADSYALIVEVPYSATAAEIAFASATARAEYSGPRIVINGVALPPDVTIVKSLPTERVPHLAPGYDTHLPPPDCDRTLSWWRETTLYSAASDKKKGQKQALIPEFVETRVDNTDLEGPHSVLEDMMRFFAHNQPGRMTGTTLMAVAIYYVADEALAIPYMVVEVCRSPNADGRMVTLVKKYDAADYYKDANDHIWPSICNDVVHLQMDAADTVELANNNFVMKHRFGQVR